MPENVPLTEHEELKEKYDEALKDVEELEVEIDEKDEIIKELKSCKDREEVREVVRKYSDLDEEFDSLISEAKDSIEDLDSIVVEALYYYFRDESLPIPSPFEEDRLDEIKTQMEYEFLCGSLGDDHEAGDVYVCESNPKIEVAIDALSELRSFVWKVTDELPDDHEEEYADFVSDYRERYGYNLSFKSRNFWEEYLDM